MLIDNRDSFVWNLAEYASIFTKVKVLPNTVSLAEIIKLNPKGIIISPGPGSPGSERDVGISPKVVLDIDLPILGVCLGHQIIAHVFGGVVDRVRPMHGKSSLIRHDNEGVFRSVKNPLEVGRYHSLAVLEVPKDFKISAIDLKDRIVMGIRSKDGRIEGIQFHPESILTEREEGLKIVRNFVRICEG